MAKARTPLQALGAFALGLGLCGLFLAPLLYPVQSYRTWCGLVYAGAIPSPDGLLLTIRPATAGEAGPGSGPWVVLEARNLTRAPLRVNTLDVFGDEVDFRATDGEGRGLGSARKTGAPIEASWVHSNALPPGASIGWVCDVSRWVKIPGPGSYRVEAERIAFALGYSGRGVSNSIDIRVF
jgi:hypothetical protein